jgi:hypothetical protein
MSTAFTLHRGTYLQCQLSVLAVPWCCMGQGDSQVVVLPALLPLTRHAAPVTKLRALAGPVTQLRLLLASFTPLN